MPCYLAFKRVLDCILFNSHRIADSTRLSEGDVAVSAPLRVCTSIYGRIHDGDL